MRNNIDLRQEMDEFLDEYGFYVLVQRGNRKIQCRCYDQKFQEADSKCPICGGTGFVSRIERHKARSESAVQIISRPDMNQQTHLGRMWVDAQNFFMRHDAHPQVGDYIYEVGWDKHRPTHLIHAYRINDIVAMRGDNGRIEYWNVAAKSETLNKEFKNILVRSIGPIKNYEIIT